MPSSGEATTEVSGAFKWAWASPWRGGSIAALRDRRSESEASPDRPGPMNHCRRLLLSPLLCLLLFAAPRTVRAEDEAAPRFAVQVGAFAELKYAIEVANRLPPNQLVHVQSVGEDCCPDLFRVRVGDFSRREDAVSASKKLADAFPGAYVVPVAAGRFDRLLRLAGALAHRLDKSRPEDPSASVRAVRLVDLSLFASIEWYPDWDETDFSSVVEVTGATWTNRHGLYLGEECDGTWLVSDHPIAREWLDGRGGVRLSSLLGTDE